MPPKKMAKNVSSTHANTSNLSRRQLLGWVNDTLQAEFVVLEDVCTGACYCQLMDLLFHGSVPMRRVKFYTNLEHEYLANYKLLQAAFEQKRVHKIIPMAKLVKGSYLENFEFLQWFKLFFDINYDSHEYDPVVARNGQRLGRGTCPSNLARSIKFRRSSQSQDNASSVGVPRSPSSLRTERSYHRVPLAPHHPNSSSSLPAAVPRVVGTRFKDAATEMKDNELENYYLQLLLHVEDVCRSEELHPSEIIKSILNIIRPVMEVVDRYKSSQI